MAKMFSMEDWEKTTIEEVKMRWGNRRKELEEVEKKKAEREKKIDEAKKKKEEKRRRAIRERRCFVCGIFGHMARYCRNRGEEKRGSLMPQNKFEVLKDRVMQRGEGSGKEVVKERREILREEREKKGKKITAQKKGQEKKKEKKVDDEKEEIKKEIEIEREVEVEMRGFSGGEILKGRYPLAWWKVQCYECGGLGHRKRDHCEIKKMKRDHGEMKTMKKEKDKGDKNKIGDKKKEIVREEKKIEDKEKEKQDKKDKTKKKKKSDKKKI